MNKTHGMWRTPTWYSWNAMMSRCTNVNMPNYHRYGGRGIKVCERWLSFENFYADMGERPIGTSLDRIDNNGDYCPENCRWTSCKEQNRNTRKNVLLTFEGKTKCVAEWAEELNVKVMTLYKRLRLGWSDEKVLCTPLRKLK